VNGSVLLSGKHLEKVLKFYFLPEPSTLTESRVLLSRWNFRSSQTRKSSQLFVARRERALKKVAFIFEVNLFNLEDISLAISYVQSKKEVHFQHM